MSTGSVTVATASLLVLYSHKLCFASRPLTGLAALRACFDTGDDFLSHTGLGVVASGVDFLENRHHFEGASLFEVAGSVRMRVFCYECVVFGVTHVWPTFAIDASLTALTLEVGVVLDSVRAGFVISIVLRFVPLRFWTRGVLENFPKVVVDHVITLGFLLGSPCSSQEARYLEVERREDGPKDGQD